MAVSVVNQGKQMRTVILDHKVVCVRFGKCFCSRVDDSPGVLLFPAGMATKNVTDAVRLANGIGELNIIDQASRQDKEPPTPASPASEDKPGKRARGKVKAKGDQKE